MDGAVWIILYLMQFLSFACFFLMRASASSTDLLGFRDWIGNFISRKRLVKNFMFLAINTIITVNTASAIYEEENGMLIKPVIKNKAALFKGPLITSIYALLLNSLALVGLFYSVYQHLCNTVQLLQKKKKFCLLCCILLSYCLLMND